MLWIDGNIFVSKSRSCPKINSLQNSLFCITFYYPNDHKILTTTLQIQLVHPGDITNTTANNNNNILILNKLNLCKVYKAFVQKANENTWSRKLHLWNKGNYNLRHINKRASPCKIDLLKRRRQFNFRCNFNLL